MFERNTAINTMSAQVARILGMRIVSGEFSPGDALPIENELCRFYGVSRSTIREAVKNLSAKRLVEVAPKIGTRVRPFADWNLLDPDVLAWRLNSQFDRRIVEDLYEMRNCFEPRACQLAVGEGTEAELALIQQKYTDLATTMANPDLAADAEVEFHLAIIAATHNGLFVSIGGAVKTALRASFALMQHRQPAPRSDLLLYEAVLRAIVERRGDDAFKRMVELLDSSRRTLLHSLEHKSVA
jgi:DNA-binding FadR family transcriptional regulator